MREITHNVSNEFIRGSTVRRVSDIINDASM